VSLASGVHSVLVTPFAPDESLDEASLRTLIDYYVAAGVAGVLVLGVLGEADKLSDAERERVQSAALAHAA
jgi:4-hydroxy-tetrahydrodipicolinate synthase